MAAICNFIKVYEIAVWHYLSRVFSYDLIGSELGFTDDLIYRITKCCDLVGSRGEVYSIPGYRENVRGADIDLFIKKGARYDHYMVQSKIMDHCGKFSSIKKCIPINVASSQYQVLINAAQSESAYPLYLLYCGKTTGSSHGKSEYGYSIIDAQSILNFRINQYKQNPSQKGKNTPLITFNDLFNELKPLHYLFCDDCVTGYTLPRGKAYADIYKEHPYRRILPRAEMESRNRLDTIKEEERLTKEAKDIIDSKHLAHFRIIINE